jgi:hypothetical protein
VKGSGIEEGVLKRLGRMNGGEISLSPQGRGRGEGGERTTVKMAWTWVWQAESRPTGLGTTDYEEGVVVAFGRVKRGQLGINFRN